MTPEQREELKPCPFCGGPVTLERAMRIGEMGARDWWGIKCRNTMNLGGTCAIEQIPSGSPEAAIERWNRRAQVEALTVPQVYPMSTAPHDGTEVLAWSKTGKTWHQVYWKTKENGDWLFLPPFQPRWAMRWNEAYYQGQAEFSHWTPIPAAPTIPAIPGTKEGA